MSAGKFLAGFVVGGVLGAVAGVLLAPQSGEETRELLSDASKDMVKKTDKTVKEIQQKADIAVSDMQKKGDEIMEKIQTLINKQKGEKPAEETN
ncbi:MAG TPA: YtxH domain-containing protein [Candidatus Gastranaerophilaceae bacterium]|nr:YtxH domain-containing protein [Candidatus Gastranaerophilaceae bacterium]HPT41549.1 YtxH domain-containing protein [Candidatus Gastranaerophilaceae bacterium]